MALALAALLDPVYCFMSLSLDRGRCSWLASLDTPGAMALALADMGGEVHGRDPRMLPDLAQPA